MGDDEHAGLRPAEGVDPVRDDLEGVDVQTGIGFVEQGEGRLQHGHLQDFAALFLAAGESLVDRARGEIPRHLEEIHFLVKLGVIFGGLQFLTLGQARLQGGTEEVGDGHPGNFARVLEGEENTLAGPRVGLHDKDALAVEKDIAGSHRVVGMAGDDFGQRAFARTVRPHDGVHLTGRQIEAQAAEDFAVADADVQVVNFEMFHKISDGFSGRSRRGRAGKLPAASRCSRGADDGAFPIRRRAGAAHP